MKSSPFFFNRSRHSFIFRTPCDTDLEMDWPTDLLDYLEAYQVIITHTIEIQTTKRMTFKKLTRIWIWCWIKIKRRINTLCFSNPLCISFWVHFSFFIDKEVVSSSPSRSYSYYYSSSLPRIIFTLNHHYYHHNPLLVVHAGHGGNFIHFFFLSFFKLINIRHIHTRTSLSPLYSVSDWVPESLSPSEANVFEEASLGRMHGMSWQEIEVLKSLFEGMHWEWKRETGRSTGVAGYGHWFVHSDHLHGHLKLERQ